MSLTAMYIKPFFVVGFHRRFLAGTEQVLLLSVFYVPDNMVAASLTGGIVTSLHLQSCGPSTKSAQFPPIRLVLSV